MERLTDEAISQHLAKLPNWTLDGKTIQRRFKFAAFMAAVAFANEVATIAERRNHHPFIAIDYRVVTLRLTSWHAGGLTTLDMEEAADFDAVYAGLDK